jgi:hypothetical protein
MKDNYHQHKTALMIALALCSGSMAFASESQDHHGVASSGHDTSHSGFSYNYGELRYINMTVDDHGSDLDGNGFEFEGSVGIGDRFQAYALYEGIGFDHGIDLKEWAVGFGTHFSMAPGLDLVADLGYISETLSEEGHGSHDDEGYVLGAGMRKQVGERGEIAFAIDYTDFKSAGSTTSYELIGEMHVLPTLAIGVGINTSKTATAYFAEARFYFGGH